MTKKLSKTDQKPEVLIIDGGRFCDDVSPGNVSARDMMAKKLLSPDVAEHATQHINDYYVSTGSSAKTRCIDGRHDPSVNERNLGPQVPGGAPGVAFAYRLGVDEDDLTRGNFLHDAETMIASFARLGFHPGGHRDNHKVHGSLAVGCGAIDNMDKVLAIMLMPQYVDDIKRIVKFILGKNFRRGDYLQVMGAALMVNARAESYFAGRQKIIDILEQKFKRSVTTLEGDHKEFLIVVNLVAGTTLASNRFASDHNGFQAFGYDLWRSAQMTQKLLPRPDQTDARNRFIMARVITSVATLLALTDGSQKLLIRIPATLQ